MQTIAICEDERIWQEQLLSILKSIPTYGELDIRTYTDGNELLCDFSYGKFDLIFLDIYMDGCDGVKTAAAIRKVDPDVTIVFTTTSREYALDAFRLNVSKYIEKPAKQIDILECLQISDLRKKSRKTITLLISGRERSFAQCQIVCFEQKNHSILLHLSDGDILSFTGRLDNLQNSLPGDTFYRCHKSYLVNFNQVSYLNKELNVFAMSDGTNAYIRREKMREAEQLYDQYLFDRLKRGA